MDIGTLRSGMRKEVNTTVLKTVHLLWNSDSHRCRISLSKGYEASEKDYDEDYSIVGRSLRVI